MSETRIQTGQDRLTRLSKVFIFSTENHKDSITKSLKLLLLVLIGASISIVFYSLFISKYAWFTCPDCETFDPICEPEKLTEQEPLLQSQTHSLNISHLAFGISGSTRTWSKRNQYSQLWWRPNITRGFVFLDEEPDPNTQWSQLSPPYKISSDWKQFKYSSSQSAVRIARVISDLFRVGLPDVRWFVMGDDDTVFFEENLVSVLSRYDHRKMVYVGGNSESVEQDVMHSFGMAFGGGGFAVSYTLAVELVKLMDGCLERYYYFYGSDQRVWACVGELGVGLSREPGFHQFDIRGDPYGLLAAHPPAPLVSLHHLDYVKSLFPDRTQIESLNTLVHAHHLDPERLMQQTICYNRRLKWSVSISWGYTLQIYPIFLTARDLETPLQTFQTWRSWSNGPFTFNTRPLSPDPCQQPITFYLDKMKKLGKGGTVTTYTKFVSNPGKKCDKAYYQALAVKRIFVSAPKVHPTDLRKEMRRHCCDIKTVKHGSMKIRIRSCKQNETYTS
ncbi:hypothetical protein Leryth_026987 [Lithospermum erythrorhizon]|nr:hypothetical protein Leryth_026987 [Lithospermum erythrorhizon]